MKLCYRNGIFLPLEEACIPVSHLALQRGVGIFESLRTYRERPFALSQHLDRLYLSARLARMTPPIGKEELEVIIREGLKRIDGEAMAKPYFLCGAAMDNDSFPDTELIVTFEPIHTISKTEYDNGVSLLPVDFGRPFPEIKTINYMAPYVARMLAGSKDLEVLYCPGGRITESTASTFFAALDGKIVTAPRGTVLSGVTRNILIDLARKEGFQVEERLMDLDELRRAQEAFLTGSVKEVTAVVRVGDITIGSGRPGPVSTKLRHLLLNNLDNWLE